MYANIQALINKAVAACDTPVALRVVHDNSTDLWIATITGDAADDIVTLESDWDVQLRAAHEAVDGALAALDAICARDFPPPAPAPAPLSGADLDMRRPSPLTQRNRKPNTCDLGTYTVAELPKGEFVRRGNRDRVWVRGEYDRQSKRYSLTAWDDVNREVLVKGTERVTAGFSF